MRTVATLKAMKTVQTMPVVWRVAAYLRVSTDEQAESGLGIDAQRTQVRAMAVVKGYPAPTEYVDNGISGTKDVDKRPALHALMEDVAAGNVDVVVIPSLDRLGRKTQRHACELSGIIRYEHAHRTVRAHHLGRVGSDGKGYDSSQNKGSAARTLEA